ncbi:MAG: sigma-70 family RNA polymerase sigma factor [Planctomycetes bacterium]|nr:sigma-70 family RNA polymerase sigma factor [Planctomycetota bacterium]
MATEREVRPMTSDPKKIEVEFKKMVRELIKLRKPYKRSRNKAGWEETLCGDSRANVILGDVWAYHLKSKFRPMAEDMTRDISVEADDCLSQGYLKFRSVFWKFDPAKNKAKGGVGDKLVAYLSTPIAGGMGVMKRCFYDYINSGKEKRHHVVSTDAASFANASDGLPGNKVAPASAARDARSLVHYLASKCNLKPNYIKALLLHRVEKISQPDVGIMLGVGNTAISGWIKEAMEALEEVVKIPEASEKLRKEFEKNEKLRKEFEKLNEKKKELHKENNEVLHDFSQEKAQNRSWGRPAWNPFSQKVGKNDEEIEEDEDNDEEIEENEDNNSNT